MSQALPRVSFAEATFDPAALRGFLAAVRDPAVELHSFMLIRHGAVFAEGSWQPYALDEPHLLYSLTKSFTSTAVGFAVDEGLFGLDDLIADHFSEQLPSNPNPNLAKVKVRHLLSMSVGHDTEPNLNVRTADWRSAASSFLAHPVPFEPGTKFQYNTAATNMLSILIQKCSEETLDEYLESRLLCPLGITETIWSRGADWVWGGSGLHAPTEAVGKLGLLYLNNGNWNGRRLLPEGWAQLATSSHIDNGSDPDSDWCQGYGFQFWRSRHGYRGDGAFGQFCLVLPEYDSVIALTSGQSDMQMILDAVWEHLLPGFESAIVSAEPSHGTLELRPAGPVVGEPLSIHLEAKDEQFSFVITGDRVMLDWGLKLDIALGVWTRFSFDFGREEVFPAAACGRWTSPTEFEFKICNLRTPESQILNVSLNDGKALVTFSEKGVFGPADLKSFAAELAP